MSARTLPRFALSIAETAAATHTGETLLRKEIDAGHLIVSRVGDRVLIEPGQIEDWLRRRRYRGREPVTAEDVAESVE
jgi:hypothetical protein